MRGNLSNTTKLFQNEMKLANWWSYYVFMTRNFTLSYISKCIGFQYFLFTKIIRHELSDSRNIQGFALIDELSCSSLKSFHRG